MEEGGRGRERGGREGEGGEREREREREKERGMGGGERDDTWMDRRQMHSKQVLSFALCILDHCSTSSYVYTHNGSNCCVLQIVSKVNCIILLSQLFV